MEQCAHDEQARRQGHPNRQPILGNRLPVLRNLLLDHHIRHDSKRDSAEEHADARGKIRQADGACPEAVLLREDKGEGAEHEIQHAVDDSDIEREDEDGGLGEEHLHWADAGVAEALFGYIRNGATAVRHRRRAGETHEEAKDDQHGHVGAKGRGDGHDEEEDVGDVEDDGAAVDLAERCGEQRAEGEA
ncbi:hypothetical protein HG530_001699 [Fusarium avenaceum]|nr:hypothetical protein HG530_001699 [Fusarium avenaceum]